MHISSFSFHSIHVNSKTNWSFIRIELGDGTIGWGECSLNGWERVQDRYATEFGSSLIGKVFHTAADAAELCQCYPHSPGGLIAHSVKSATEVALIDAAARYRGKSVYALLAEERNLPIERTQVEVYANINRATSARTPAGFATSAAAAVAAGFGSVKIAPFDGVLPRNCELESARKYIDDGIARVYAVREAVGDSVSIKVDCHWRFTATMAVLVFDRLMDARLDWLECPVSEHVEQHGAIAMLRRRANDMGVRLAGAEMQTGCSGFRPFIEGGLYDTIMPDVKYCGGMGALLDIAALAQKHSVQTAPHNPTGPICNYASLQTCAISAGCDLLEYQLGESELFRLMVFNEHPKLVDGKFTIPNELGVGAACDLLAFDQHPLRPVSEGLHPSLG
jgi:galactonate dehydratase